MKNYGYKWWLGGTERSRSWCIDVGEKTLDSELEYLSKEIYERDGLDKSLKYLENNKLGIFKGSGDDFDKRSWINLWNYTHSIESSVALLKNNPERHYKILLNQ